MDDVRSAALAVLCVVVLMAHSYPASHRECQVVTDSDGIQDLCLSWKQTGSR